MNTPRLLPTSLPAGLSRRHFLAASAALASWPLLEQSTYGVVRRAAKLTDYPFKLGVASGDPLPLGVVLWTRLAPDPLTGGGMPDEAIEVAWEVAADEAFTRIAQQGTIVATAADAHSVHVEVEGLEPNRWYFYRFHAAGETSPIARTRTAPALDVIPERLKFAFASCQHWEAGYYSAYEAMLRESLDLVVHLGDYIYEGKGVADKIRRHSGDREIETLAEYRNRHAQYKTDVDLQAMHQACPWLVTWDDHEFDNNCAGAISEEVTKKIVAEEFLKRRAAAYKAYYEHMPLRKACLPKGPDMQLYRRVAYGRLAQFDVLDTRQYRSDQPCGDGNKPAGAESFDPGQTLLGEAQEKWLLEGLATSPATWNVLAQQVMMGYIDRKPGEEQAFSMDQWPGYEANRRRMLKFYGDRKIANPVVLTGDIHSNWVNNLRLDFENLNGATVATEFVGSSISSGGNGPKEPKDLDKILSENPFCKFHNVERGYVTCEVTPQRWTSHYRIATDVTKRSTPVVTRASFVVEAGKPGAETA